jgi:hypothetical protein
MVASQLCYLCAKEAVDHAREALQEIPSLGGSDFDRQALNVALELLEKAVAELTCFASKMPPRARPGHTPRSPRQQGD